MSIHSIYTTRREVFYWLAVLCTFALGTSAGDLIAERLNVGYAWSAVLFAVAIAMTAGARRLGAGAVLTFWTAYVLTRPLGASIGDSCRRPAPTAASGSARSPRARSSWRPSSCWWSTCPAVALTFSRPNSTTSRPRCPRIGSASRAARPGPDPGRAAREAASSRIGPRSRKPPAPGGHRIPPLAAEPGTGPSRHPGDHRPDRGGRRVGKIDSAADAPIPGPSLQDADADGAGDAGQAHAHRSGGIPTGVFEQYGEDALDDRRCRRHQGRAIDF